MPTVGDHFRGREPSVRAIYDRILSAAARFGPVVEKPNTGSIHRNRRFRKREQASANRWHLEMHLDDPAQVDRQLKAWLKSAYELSG